MDRTEEAVLWILFVTVVAPFLLISTVVVVNLVKGIYNLL